MTREEALSIMKVIVYMLENKYDTDRVEEAVDMAIQILKQQPCEDCISRQAVLEQLDAYCKNNCKYTEAEQKVMCRACDTGSCIELIEDMPSVTPTRAKGEWIPVSERLPEDGRPVLIYAWNVYHVIARYGSFRTENGYKNTWVTADAWNGNTEITHEVIAWMPLPEPYKELKTN